MAEELPMVEVSVVMPAWRAADTVGRALQSVAAQTVLPREVIVVDDGSDDGTSERAEAMRARLAPVSLKVVRQANAGPGAARNRAISESACSVLAFLDADDEWMPDKLAVSLRALDDPGVALVAHNIVVRDGDAETSVDCARHLPHGADAFVALYKRGFISTATVVCRRTAVEEVGGFDESLPSGQDYELWLSIARNETRRFVLLADRLTRYHVVAGSISSKIGLRRRCAARIAIRHAAGLRGRVAVAAVPLFARFAIITVEALTAHRQRSQWGAAAADLLVFPVVLIAGALSLLGMGTFGAPAVRSAPGGA
jgi:teichuronic acid biosynthesis glycosyltransferase TuaG